MNHLAPVHSTEVSLIQSVDICTFFLLLMWFLCCCFSVVVLLCLGMFGVIVVFVVAGFCFLAWAATALSQIFVSHELEYGIFLAPSQLHCFHLIKNISGKIHHYTKANNLKHFNNCVLVLACFKNNC